MPTEKDLPECPFGISERFCKHQETRAKDILSAMQGDLVFLCVLGDIKDCPELFNEMFKEINNA